MYNQSVCFYVSLYFFLFNFIYNRITFRIYFMLYSNLQLSVSVRREYVFAWCPMPHSLNLICNMTMGAGSAGKIFATMLLHL